MSVANAALDIPKKPAERRAWILYRLKASVGGFRALARRVGCAGQSLADVASGKPNLRLEGAIAEAIGVDPKKLFSEHYTASGERIPSVRGPSKADKSACCHTPASGPGNVKNAEAA